MGARHARDDEPTVAVPQALHLVETGPGPEVRAVLDAVADLHSAMIAWAATIGDPRPPHALPPPDTGRHRRHER